MQARLLATNLVYLFLTIVESFLGLRFVLKLFGANPNNAFVSWIYDMSGVLLEPFRGIFPAHVLQNRYVLEFSTLFAMMIYAIVALILLYLIGLITAPAVVEEPVTTTTRTKRIRR